MNLTNAELIELLDNANASFKSLPFGFTAKEAVKQIQQALSNPTVALPRPDAVNVYSDKCFTVNLDVLIKPVLKFKPLVCRKVLLNELKVIFDSVNDLKMWPKVTETSEKMLSLIAQSFSLDYFNVLINRPNNLLVIGNPDYIPLYVPEVDRVKLNEAVIQFREIEELYPNWMIQSNLPTEQL